MCLACRSAQLCHWQHRRRSRVCYLAKCYHDCFVGWADDRQVVAGFVEVTGGPGVEESSSDEFRGVSPVEATSLLEDVFS